MAKIKRNRLIFVDQTGQLCSVNIDSVWKNKGDSFIFEHGADDVSASCFGVSQADVASVDNLLF